MGSHIQDEIDQNTLDVTGARGHEQVLDAAFPRSNVLIWSDTNHETSSTKIGDLFSVERIAELSRRGVTDIFLEDLEAGQPFVAQLIADQDIDKFVAEYDRIADPLYTSQEEFLQKARDTAHMILVAAEMRPPINVHFVQIAFTPEQNQALGEFEEQIFAIEDNAFVDITDIVTQFSQYAELTESDRQLLMDGHLNEYIVDDRAVFNLDIIRAQFGDRVPEEIIDNAIERIADLKNRHFELSQDYNRLADQFRVDNDVILSDRMVEEMGPDGRAVLVHGAGHGNDRDGINGVDIDELLLQRGFSSTRVNVVYDSLGLYSAHSSPDPTELTYYPEDDRFTVHNLDNGNPNILGFEGVSPVPQYFRP